MKKTSIFVLSFCLVLVTTICQAEIFVNQISPKPVSVAMASYIGGPEMVSRFVLTSAVDLQKITWTGLIANKGEGLYPFTIRLYDSQGKRPKRKSFVEFKGDAQLTTTDSRNLFTYTLDDNFHLPAGRYWISILYAGASEDMFSIQLEDATYGHGGAARITSESIWFPLNFIFPYPYLLSRGASIRIEGESASVKE